MVARSTITLLVVMVTETYDGEIANVKYVKFGFKKNLVPKIIISKCYDGSNL